MTDEEKKALELAEAKKKAEESIKNLALTQAEKTAQDIVNKMMGERNEELMKQFSSKEEYEESRKEFAKQIAELSAEIKKNGQIKKKDEKQKSFEEMIKSAITENAEAISNFKKGDAPITMAVKDMSLENNFPNHTPFTQDVRQGLIPMPYNRVWLSDLLPTGTSTGSSILFPKEEAPTGAPAIWDKSGNKAEMEFNFDSQKAHFKWLAGTVTVDREMLDDINWLGTYIGQKMLVMLKMLENNFILSGATGTEPVAGLKPSAKNYDGAFTNSVDRVIDAVYGQIPEKTEQWYQGNNILLSPRATVGLGLNKADGSGEYDLPDGSIAFSNGTLSIGGIRTTPTTGIANDEFLAFDNSATMYIRRMEPELRMYEDSTLAKQNKIMFRVEMRSTLVTFNDDAIVYGDLKGTGMGE